MLRIIRELKPRYIVGENVGGIVSWDGGLVFEQVQAEMEAEGYEVQAFVLPACAVNAPHRRDRVWFVAHRSDSRNDSFSGGIDGNRKAKSGQIFRAIIEAERKMNP
jgi:DNA (cytosine-5)-methyltransferase 1